MKHQYGSSFFRAALRRTAGGSRTQLLGALMVALLALPFQPVAAQQTSARSEQPIVVELEQFKIVKDQDGNEQRVDADSVKPGDIVEYRATYRNATQSAVAGLVAELPIPQGTQYQAKSAGPARIPVEAATQDKNYAREPLVRKVMQPDGRQREERVPYAEYRSLRWTLGELQAGREVAVSARVQVSPIISQLTEQPEAERSAATAARQPSL